MRYKANNPKKGLAPGSSPYVPAYPVPPDLRPGEVWLVCVMSDAWNLYPEDYHFLVLTGIPAGATSGPGLHRTKIKIAPIKGLTLEQAITPLRQIRDSQYKRIEDWTPMLSRDYTPTLPGQKIPGMRSIRYVSRVFSAYDAW